jgi:hypothetical protein
MFLQANQRALGNSQTPASSTEISRPVQKQLRSAITSLAMFPVPTAQYISHMTDLVMNFTFEIFNNLMIFNHIYSD